MSTLPPTPSYNANVPVVTSSGGTSAAYNDPNSPESIMKKTTLVNAQTVVDTTYDVNQEGFRGRRFKNRYVSFFYILALLFVVFFRGKSMKVYTNIFLLILAGALIILTIVFEQNGTSGTP
jgi:hypothetical protein